MLLIRKECDKKYRWPFDHLNIRASFIIRRSRLVIVMGTVDEEKSR
jgi:hypothetical protein